jgi:hypothetical protein
MPSVSLPSQTDPVWVQYVTLFDPTTKSIVNAIQTEEVIPAEIIHGKTTVTTSGVRVQLATNTVKAITIKASSDNTGVMYVGSTGVTVSNGFPLSAGESMSFDIVNTGAVWLDASMNNQSVVWFGIA